MHNLHPCTPKLNVEWHDDRWCRISVTRTNPFWSLCLQTMLNWEREVSTVGLWKWCRISSINSTGISCACTKKCKGVADGSCKMFWPFAVACQTQIIKHWIQGRRNLKSLVHLGLIILQHKLGKEALAFREMAAEPRGERKQNPF